MNTVELKGFGFSLWTKNSMTRIYVNGDFGLNKYWLEASGEGFSIRSKNGYGLGPVPFASDRTQEIANEIAALFGKHDSEVTFVELVEACK